MKLLLNLVWAIRVPRSPVVRLLSTTTTKMNTQSIGNQECAKPKRLGMVELSTSKEEWRVIREVFVNCFRHYPLYKYMVPDHSKRDAFLRAYLDANYDVTVGSGEGVLVAIKAPSDVNNNECDEMNVVGGVLFVPPSSDGCGWAIGSDEPYWKAYAKHGLGRISPEGLERVKRYEAWENDHVSRKVAHTGISMWNGLFCAISPDHASRGLGSHVYKDVMRILSQHTKKRRESHKEGFWGRFMKNFTAKQLHRFTLLNHRAIPLAAMAEKMEQQQPKQPQLPKKDLVETVEPLVAAISHSDRSASFHKGNGFHPVARIPFYDTDGSVPFYAHMLVMDPFGTGQVDQFTCRYNRPKKTTVVPKLTKDIRRVVDATIATRDDFVIVEM